jgi:hypothetical protein
MEFDRRNMIASTLAIAAGTTLLHPAKALADASYKLPINLVHPELHLPTPESLAPILSLSHHSPMCLMNLSSFLLASHILM